MSSTSSTPPKLNEPTMTPPPVPVADSDEAHALREASGGFKKEFGGIPEAFEGQGLEPLIVQANRTVNEQESKKADDLERGEALKNDASAIRQAQGRHVLANQTAKENNGLKEVDVVLLESSLERVKEPAETTEGRQALKRLPKLADLKRVKAASGDATDDAITLLEDGEPSLVGESELERVNREALEEFEKDSSLAEAQERETIAAQLHKTTNKEVLTKLDKLLSQATQYTKFLEDQLIGFHGQEYSEESESSSAKRVKRQVVKESELLQQPKSLTGGTLKTYQVHGFRWLTGLWENGLNGILADEMGLGKTIQTLALFAHLRDLKVYGWRMIVVPLSTMSNWIAEGQRWIPTMPMTMYHGSKEERMEIILGLKKVMKNDCEIPIVVTTYEIVCRDRRELSAFNWTYLVVDEGHRLKNRNCRLIKELNLLVGRKPAVEGGCSKLLLTGTPLQNDLTELWSLLNFLLPQVFSNLDFFMSVFELDEGGKGNPNEKRIMNLQKEENIVSKLHRILRPFMLRRLKSQVEKDLPPKMEILLYCGMTPDQRELYDSIKRGELQQLLKTSSSNGTTEGRSYLNIIMQLRKAANHPFLHFDSETGTTDERIISSSGKMVVLDLLLTELKKRNHKVLIFSQFTSMLDIIDDYLRFLRPQHKYCRLDGSTHHLDRKDLMAKFNGEEDCFIFLLSTRAGGVGINLASSDTVILFDSDWNPHQDSQAQDRAHRIGQTRPVAVFRLVTPQSVELKIIARANSKRKLERVVCRSNKSNDMTAEELKDLLMDDFTGHLYDVGAIDLTTIREFFVNREKLFTPGLVPRKGNGFEIVEHKSSSIVGEVSGEQEEDEVIEMIEEKVEEAKPAIAAAATKKGKKNPPAKKKR